MGYEKWTRKSTFSHFHIKICVECCICQKKVVPLQGNVLNLADESFIYYGVPGINANKGLKNRKT